MKKPFIAKDTNQPLVVLSCYRIAEGGGIIREKVADNFEKPKATENDIMLLRTHGVEGLKEMGYYGVIDRLVNSEIIKK